MSEKLSKLEHLLVSKKGKSLGVFKTSLFGAIGVYLLGMSAWRYFSSGDTTNMIPNIIVGICAFFVMRYSTVNYLAPEGVVRETHTWIMHRREILKWAEIRFVTIMHDGPDTMCFFEKDVLGLKMLFATDQVNDIKAILAKYIPGVDVNEMDRPPH